MDDIRNYEHDQDRTSLLGLLWSFQEHLAAVDVESEVKQFQSDADAERYLDKMISDVTDMNGKFLVLEVDGGLAGFIQGIIDARDDQDDVMYQTTHIPRVEGWIGLVYVSSEYRGKRYGVKLIEEIKKYFIANGCTTMRLLVSRDNVDTVNFYRKYGFVEREIEMAFSLNT